MISDADLRTLMAGRWLVPLMAHVGGAGGGSRFAAMLAALGASRSALAASLAALQEAGWLARNAGHGHPLRPEYVVTAAGRADRRLLRAGDGAARAARPGARPALALVAAPGCASRRRKGALFKPARRPPSGDAARAVADPQADAVVDLVDRALEAEFPPIAIYGLTGKGRALAEAMR